MKSTLCIVPMRKIKGFVYVDYFPSNSFGSQVRLFNVFSYSKLSVTEFQKIHSVEMVPRILLNGVPRLRKYKDLYKWFKLDEYELDHDISVIKYKSGPSNKLSHIEDWSTCEPWYCFDDDNFKVKNKWEDTENVPNNKLIPIWSHFNYIGVTERIEMYWTIKMKQSIESLFGKEIKANSSSRLNYHIILNSSFLTDDVIVL